MKNLFLYALVAILILSLSFANGGYGPATMTVEKKWLLVCPTNPTCTAEFEGILITNGSNQRVVSIETEPEMEITSDDDGEIHVIYKGKLRNGSILLAANATIVVDYRSYISEDPPLVRESITPTVLTEWNEEIAKKAAELADEKSTLGTIRNETAWVHKNIEYDISYFEKKVDAKTVFVERRGVCTAYAHLLISMLNSLGIRTRYVNGYVMTKEWQPHAWVEGYIPGYGWLPLDPTFGEAGVLESSHIIVSYGSDQISDYDRFVADDELLNINSIPLRITVISIENEPKGLSIDVSFENRTYTVITEIKNERPYYEYGRYQFIAPDGYGDEVSELLLIEPNGKIQLQHRLNSSMFSPGYMYTLPIMASINGANDRKTFVVVVEENGSSLNEDCAPLFFLSAILLVAIIRFTVE